MDTSCKQITVDEMHYYSRKLGALMKRWKWRKVEYGMAKIEVNMSRLTIDKMSNKLWTYPLQ